jgi:hypothetical protein
MPGKAGRQLLRDGTALRISPALPFKGQRLGIGPTGQRGRKQGMKALGPVRKTAHQSIPIERLMVHRGHRVALPVRHIGMRIMQ